jgi:dTDP-4-dehydrorhamnose reductase
MLYLLRECRLNLEKPTFSNSDAPLNRLLIIGSTGLVGSKVASMALNHGFEAYNTQNARKAPLPQTSQLDITDRDATLRLANKISPKAIINTAALHNVDYCETHKEEAHRVNVDGVRNLAEAAQANDSRLIHLSTDYVFDGRRGHYSESDTPRPLHYYAQTKLDAERVVGELPRFAIARPSVIYGWNSLEATGVPSSSGKTINFAMFVLDKLRKNETVKAVRDQYSSPTFADNLAEALLRLANHLENGIFHTAGRSCLSRYEFAAQLAQIFGYPTKLVEPVFTSQFKQLAERPKNSCLRVDKAEKTLGMRFLTSMEGIREMKKQTLSQVNPSL